MGQYQRKQQQQQNTASTTKTTTLNSLNSTTNYYIPATDAPCISGSTFLPTTTLQTNPNNFHKTTKQRLNQNSVVRTLLATTVTASVLAMRDRRHAKISLMSCCRGCSDDVYVYGLMTCDTPTLMALWLILL